MKKLFVISLLAFFALGTMAYAESSATSMSGTNFREQQVFVIGYNGSGTDISSNNVVVIDSTATVIASGSTLGTYIDTTTTASDNLVLGVTDETIENGTAGRVCVRGPHKVYLTGLTGASVGATLATCSTAGAGDMPGYAASYKGGVFGTLMSTTAIKAKGTPGNDSGDGDGFTPGDGTSNYWVWISK